MLLLSFINLLPAAAGNMVYESVVGGPKKNKVKRQGGAVGG